MTPAALGALMPSFSEVEWQRIEQTGPSEWTVTVQVGEDVVKGVFGFDDAGRLVRDDIGYV